MNAFGISLIQIVRRWSLPLGCYYAITLAVPLANGAVLRDRVFAHHAVVVLVLPLIMIGLVTVPSALADVSRHIRAWTSRRWRTYHDRRAGVTRGRTEDVVSPSHPS